MSKRHKRAPYRPSRTPELADRDAMMIRDRMMGATYRALARNYSLSLAHAFRIAGRVPVIVPRPKKPPKSRRRPERRLRYFALRQRVYELRRLGYSYGEIAASVGVSRWFAYTYGRRVVIRELRGGAWLSHEQGRPRAWKRELLQATPQLAP